MRVVRRPRFLDDLDDAYAWIAVDNGTAAERLLHRVETVVERLRLYPMTGAPRKTWRRDYVRSG